ncbi:hypothetical protein [Acinetobacter puyangensis]|uniref:hypothetical protein n=1 Tax=Acinetobacter puyangensis TaxID=1096779 RepID=UPI003A4D27F3
MKRILLTYFFGLVGLMPLAYGADSVSPNKKDLICRNIMNYAEIVMSFRQNGLSIKDALNGNDAFFAKGDRSQSTYDLVNFLIRDAYSEPYYTSDSLKQQKINEFSERHYIGCMAMKE